eukprot:CAMPEP_0181320188 /NCGR_PEP_ID=MMETSP1101-20121128/17985_1 /TAXON_ID=46948 /ORGANISM="Rhodomonas abbreviata, Strain Caron Lab Isolate" /LENGTH=407 /DNA_ID=CAMNT_0023427865 /DNA_START=281 /DNA_END=1501 /DNA_ORIENTATION=+
MRAEGKGVGSAVVSVLFSTSLLLFACAYHFKTRFEGTASVRSLTRSFSSGPNNISAAKGGGVFQKGHGSQVDQLSWLAGGGNQIPLQAVDFKTPDGVDYHVDVEVYMESQDPSSQIFTEWVLVQVVGAPGLLDIVRLKLIPWGQAALIDTGKGKAVYTVEQQGNFTNVTLDPSGPPPSFLCQHGPSECEGNVWMSCVQELYPDVLQWFRVTTCIQARSCVEGQAPTVDSVAHTGSRASHPCGGQPSEVAPGCVKEFGIDMDIGAIRTCIQSRMGSELLLRNMVETEALDPPMQSMPWVVVGDQVLNLPNQSNLFLLGKAICDTYVRKIQPYVNGTVPRPLGCYYFPTSPPYMPEIPRANDFGISLLWAIGGVSFVSGVMILICWKYHSSIGSKGDDYGDDDGQSQGW